MKIKLGIDIIYFKRIEYMVRQYNEFFFKKILSSYEIIKKPHKNYISSYIAKCLTSKEALSKAIGSGFRNNIKFSDISIYNNKLGKPCFYISGKTKFYFLKKKIKKYELTISNENDYIISLVNIVY